MKKKDNNKEKVDYFGLMMAQLGVTLRSVWRKFSAVADIIIRLWRGVTCAIQHGWRWWWNNTFLCVMSILLIISRIFVGMCVLGAKCNEPRRLKRDRVKDVLLSFRRSLTGKSDSECSEIIKLNTLTIFSFSEIV